MGRGTGLPTRFAVAVVRRSSTYTAIESAVGALTPDPTRRTRNVSGLQAGVASQAFEPSAAQVVPGGRLGFEGAPVVQMSLVHGLPSTGRSLLSGMDMAVPALSQTAFLQLPAASG